MVPSYQAFLLTHGLSCLRSWQIEATTSKEHLHHSPRGMFWDPETQHRCLGGLQEGPPLLMFQLENERWFTAFFLLETGLPSWARCSSFSDGVTIPQHDSWLLSVCVTVTRLLETSQQGVMGCIYVQSRHSGGWGRKMVSWRAARATQEALSQRYHNKQTKPPVFYGWKGGSKIICDMVKYTLSGRLRKWPEVFQISIVLLKFLEHFHIYKEVS